jgi:hypothetical protein
MSCEREIGINDSAEPGATPGFRYWKRRALKRPPGLPATIDEGTNRTVPQLIYPSSPE